MSRAPVSCGSCAPACCVVRCEDDLTHKLVEIIRANITLKRMITNGSPQHILNEYVSLLQVRLALGYLPGPLVLVGVCCVCCWLQPGQHPLRHLWDCLCCPTVDECYLACSSM